MDKNKNSQYENLKDDTILPLILPTFAPAIVCNISLLAVRVQLLPDTVEIPKKEPILLAINFV